MRKLIITLYGLVLIGSLNAQNWSLKTEWLVFQTMGDRWSRVDFNPANLTEGVIVNNSGYACYTTNGTSWSAPASINNQNNFTCIKYIASNNILAVAPNVIFKSTNNGQSYSSVQNNTNVDPLFIDGAGNFILIGGDNGYIMWSKDGGSSFQTLKIFPTIVQSKIRVVNENFAYTHSKDGIKYTTDKGDNWQNFTITGVSVNGQTFSLPHSTMWQYWITAKSSSEWLLRVRYDNDTEYFKTTDGGQTWQSITAALKNICGVSGLKPIEIEEMYALSDGKVFAIYPQDNFKYKRIVYSPDFGNTFGCEQVIQDNSINSVNSKLIPIGFRQYSNQVYLLARGDTSDNYEVYSRVVGSSTNINEPVLNTSEPGLSIYPNPSDNEFTFVVTQDDEFMLYDVNGKMIDSFLATENKPFIYRHSLPQGVYIVRSKKNQIVKRVVVR